MAYQYDLISGKVNQVHYQPGQPDQFYHRYEYDAENRITDVYTSQSKAMIGNDALEEHDAHYEYYKHGPLARVVLGQQQVQGLDYAYTLQGWLKGVNSMALDTARDMGGDGSRTLTPGDAFGFQLNYFTGDYQSINPLKNPFPGHSAYLGTEYRPLYNGNISSMAVNIAPFNQPQLYNYQYDQLNRIVSMDVYRGFNSAANNWNAITVTQDYKERISYDANGNILSYLRNGSTVGGKPQGMDNLVYGYNKDGSGNLQNNKLKEVKDDLSLSGNYTEDIDSQPDNNYGYDAIGNLISDQAEKITNIDWSVYGKILSITKNATVTGDVQKISYTYDAAGNRISKKVEARNKPDQHTWYVRDASGNVMAVYSLTGNNINTSTLSLSETHLYGSSRLGIFNRSVNMDDPPAGAGTANLLGITTSDNFTRGNKFFELSNHLGNVLVTVSDKKPGSDLNADGLIDQYQADVISATDYYPFGMQMVGRKFTSSSSGYRYGFNGKERSDEVYGDGNVYDYGFRIYNPKLGRFLSTDPLYKEYAHLTPYQFASNSPIFSIDRDGREFEPYWATTVPQKIHEYEADLYRKDPDHAAQIIFQKNVNAFLFVGGALTAGAGASLFTSYGTAATLTNITAGAVTTYTTYSVASANLGAFVVELLNPDPNGTPGLEFTQGDEVARGLKLLFKQTAASLVKPIEKFIVNTAKLNYLFGKLEYQNLKGADLEAYASNAGRTVESLVKNQGRASSMAKVFEYWGIKDNEAGLLKLGNLFSAGLNGKVVNTKTDQFGTSVTREIPLIFTAGEKKGQSAGSIQISYFYKDGNMAATPEISSVIPIPDKSVN